MTESIGTSLTQTALSTEMLRQHAEQQRAIVDLLDAAVIRASDTAAPRAVEPAGESGGAGDGRQSGSGERPLTPNAPPGTHLDISV